MPLFSCRFVLSTFLAGGLAAAATSEAQVVRYGYGGVRVRAPGVGVSVGPFGGVRVRAPGVYVGAPGPAFVPQPLFVPRPVFGPFGFVPPGFVPPGYAPPSRGVVSGGGAFSGHAASRGGFHSGTITFATPNDSSGVLTRGGGAAGADAGASGGAEADARFAALSDSELAAELTAAGEALMARLATVQHGAGWQGYLKVDAAVSGDPAAAQALLRRYDSVARDAEFAVIARLGEFRVVHAALREVASRGAAAAAPDPAAADAAPKQEVLPAPPADTPAADASANDNGGPAAEESAVDLGGGGGIGVEPRAASGKVERSVLKDR